MLLRGWVPAGALAVGDRVRNADGAYGIVQARVVEPRSAVMYNLTVATAHTFFVGEGRWLVHNSCDVDGEALARTAAGIHNKLPDNLKQSTVAVTRVNGCTYVAVCGRTPQITADAVDHIRQRGWNVLDAPALQADNSFAHAERQLYDTFQPDVIGISGKEMCTKCRGFFSDKSTNVVGQRR